MLLANELSNSMGTAGCLLSEGTNVKALISFPLRPTHCFSELGPVITGSFYLLAQSDPTLG